MDSARALIARGWGVSLVSRCLRVSRAQLYVILRRTDDWMDGRRSRHTDDTDVLLRISSLRGCRTISTANRELSLTTMRIKRIRQHCCPVLNRPGKPGTFLLCSQPDPECDSLSISKGTAGIIEGAFLIKPNKLH
ncbi:IS2 transposase TnpB [Escherichia coli O111:H11 str. CVM9545]|nr:IS2 transposase TnpB [Escherichia coli O111:H11 str. CVM9534]EIL32894.1 IS2 transposase TnpB [Escherichia coli O111:H11 str. CVM9545]EIL36014.1 insertion element IS2 transposase InsD [Escherichia coli O26:H11 str. CVM10026]EIL39727.1 IS2 transposase TnpB [Escherichia coli O26:H11 str. CVM9942]EJE84945.1 IS2 transposase TnpB [Escherichia coli O111:H11 str. CVM9455]EJE86326.1 IS2 transposase TnpB [Escherichia coli O111:H11 str. CVM9553]EJE88453.1 IS2 transposase TnpB [Escherichia coli O26:H1